MRHIIQHPYVCFACGKGFKYDHTLDFHIKSQHGAENETASGSAGGNTTTVSGKNKSLNLKSLNRKSGDSLIKVKEAEAHLPKKLMDSSQMPLIDLGLKDDVLLPMNLQIKSEKVLISILEGVHPMNEQIYSLYKCCLCGFAFPSLDPVIMHIQSMHSNSFKISSMMMDEPIDLKVESSFADSNNNITPMNPLSFLHSSLLPSSLGLPFPPSQLTSAAAAAFAAGISSQPQHEKNKQSHCQSVASVVSGISTLTTTTSGASSTMSSGVGPRSASGSASSSSSSGSVNGNRNNSFGDVVEKFREPIGDIEETAPGQFKCRYCEKTFDRIFSVHRHERVHTGYKPCICRVCGRGFSEKRNLRHHIIRFHSDGSGRELLKRVRKQNVDKDEHDEGKKCDDGDEDGEGEREREETGKKGEEEGEEENRKGEIRPFKCEFCDYQSRTNSQLKVHVMRHAGIKQYLCHTCNYNGVTQSDLNRHRKTQSHKSRSGNVCAICSLGFSTQTLLEDHIFKSHDNNNNNNKDERWSETSPPELKHGLLSPASSSSPPLATLSTLPTDGSTACTSTFSRSLTTISPPPVPHFRKRIKPMKWTATTISMLTKTAF